MSTSLVVLAAMLTAALGAQEPETIRVTTRLVQVSVTARNGSGEPVSDLSKNDFEISDNGKPQVISFFSLDAQNPVAPKAGAGDASALPRNTFSNRANNRTASGPGVVIVLFDLLNTDFTDQSSARKQLVQLMRSMPVGERIGLYVLGRKLTVLHDFTDDPAQLAAVLARFTGESPRQVGQAQSEANAAPVDLSAATSGTKPGGNGSSGSDPFAEISVLLAQGRKTAGDFYTVDRARTTFGAFEGIAKHVSYVPGRKSLVWVSGSFPFSMGVGLEDQQDLRTDREYRSFRPEFERATAAVNAANLAVYPVDARGLTTSSEYSALRAPGVGMERPRMRDTAVSNIDTMKNMAAMTGGRAYYNRNDIGNAVRKAVEDGHLTYTLGFYPAEAADNKFHHVKVRMKRKGVNVSYREGYLAVAGTEAASDPKLELQRAVSSPLEAAAIGLTATIEKPTAAGSDWSVLTNIDAHDLAVEQKDNKWTGHLKVVYSVQAETGKELGGVLDDTDLNLKPEVWARVQAKGLPLQKKFNPPAGASKVRIAVYDVGTGRMGTITVPLER